MEYDGKLSFFGKSTTTRQDKNEEYSLYIDSYPPNCVPRNFRIIVTQDKPNEEGLGKSEIMQGEVRIDNLPATPIQYVFFHKKDSKIFGFETENILRNENFIKQVTKGQMINFKFKAEKKTYNLRFTLRNASNVVRTARDFCKEEAAFQDTGAKNNKDKNVSPSSAPQKKPTPEDDDKNFFK